MVQQAFHEEAVATTRLPINEAEEATRPLTDLKLQYGAVIQLDRLWCKLRKNSNTRRTGIWVDIVNNLRSEQEKDLSGFAFAQIENGRA